MFRIFEKIEYFEYFEEFEYFDQFECLEFFLNLNFLCAFNNYCVSKHLSLVINWLSYIVITMADALLKLLVRG
jgi:hypothetical protein